MESHKRGTTIYGNQLCQTWCIATSTVVTDQGNHGIGLMYRITCYLAVVGCGDPSPESGVQITRKGPSAVFVCSSTGESQIKSCVNGSWVPDSTLECPEQGEHCTKISDEGYETKTMREIDHVPLYTLVQSSVESDFFLLGHQAKAMNGIDRNLAYPLQLNTG